MQTRPLGEKAIPLFKRIFTEAIKRFHLPPDNVSNEQKHQTKLHIDPHTPPTKIESKRDDQVGLSYSLVKFQMKSLVLAKRHS